MTASTTEPRLDPTCALAEWGAAKLAIPNALGTVVAVPLGTDEGRAEVAIDLVREGKVRQLAVVGVSDGTHDSDDGLNVHVWADGDDSPSEVVNRRPYVLSAGFDDASGPWYRCVATTRGEGGTVPEDKDGFARTLSMALASSDPERYGAYAADPMYVSASLDGTEEFLFSGPWATCVTGDSLTAVGRAALALADGDARHRIPASTARRVLSRLDDALLERRDSHA